MSISALHCVLCGADMVSSYARDNIRDYIHCHHCQLIFVPDNYHLDTAAEKRRYDQHQNDPDDARYRTFLARLMDPLLPMLSAGDRGLDYGSGPGPTLSLMFEERGFPMCCYDIYYAANQSVLQGRYHFITCSEAIEHFRQPGREWDRLMSLLRPGGWLGIMTRMRDDIDSFNDWYYKNDPTHIGFYSKPTFRWLASQYRLDIEFYSNDVVLFHSPLESASSNTVSAS